MKRNALWALLCFALVVVLTCSFASVAFGADAAFEKSIAAFPESYRVKLRELHEQYPDWEFSAVDTGLDWNDAVNAESSGGRSLVEISDSYTNLFKSKNTGDYNYSSSSYIQKDGGFCAANKFCVSYFMDPRNFLNEENIFQFELLSFDESFTVEAVDLVLSGTFMYNKKITYLTSEGESKTLSQTYAEVIHQAGELYDVNPCYLAAKIRNEIGSTPSGSVTGKNSTYPGIYNFYNIGASDGAGAITRGLAWAANTTDGTYRRPWTNPKKSILGGAEFLVNTYIGKGQFTGYYQRFNVNPDGYYRVYNHQYMTNISGAAAQGYSTYRSYLSLGLLNEHFIFSLPVYRNMPGAADNTGTLNLTDAAAQTVKLSTSSAANVRTGPSTNYDKMAFSLSPGTSMTVLGTSATDSHYFDSMLRYPVWYQVKFKYEGTYYKGYLPAGFTSAETAVTVAPGLYVPKYTTSNKSLYFKFVSLDARVCEVVDDTKLNFLKEGICTVLAYDSTGRFAMVKYNVSSSAGPNDTSEPLQETEADTLAQASGLQQSNVTQTGFTLSWDTVSGATGYRVFRYDAAQSKYISVKTTKKTTYSFSSLAAGSTLKLKVRAYKKVDGKTIWGTANPAFAAKTIPLAPVGLRQTASSSNSVSLAWNAVSGADRYQLARCEAGKDDFSAVQTADGTTLSTSALMPSRAYNVKVRAVVLIGGKEYYTAYSEILAAKTGPAAVTGLKQTSASTRSLTLAWTAVPQTDGYTVYRLNDADGSLSEIGQTSYANFTVEGLSAGRYAVYAVKGFCKDGDTVYEGSVSEELLATTLPQQVVGVRQYSTKTTCLKLTWSPVPNANGYCVYRINENGSYKKIAKVTDNKALAKSLSPNTKYRFVVRAFIRANGKVYWGEYSDVYKAKTNPAKK